MFQFLRRGLQYLIKETHAFRSHKWIFGVINIAIKRKYIA